MRLKIVPSNQLRKDIKQAKKRHYDFSHLTQVIDLLAEGTELPPKYRNHPLSGNYHDFWECHVEPDWLLIYRVDGEDLELFLFRTGSHSDLF